MGNKFRTLIGGETRNKTEDSPALTVDDYLHGEELVELYKGLLRHEAMLGYEDQCALVRTVLGTGARVGELFALRLSDCFKDRIYIRDSGSGSGETKANGPRVVVLMPELRPHWPRIIKRAAEGQREFLFGHVTIKTLGRWWKGMLRRCGVRDLSIHHGRHTYATHEYGSGRLSKGALKSQLGHTMASETTDRYYLHHAPDYIYPEGPPIWWEWAKKTE